MHIMMKTAKMEPSERTKESKVQWNQRRMKKALKAVLENKMNLVNAVQEYNVPKTSLHNFVRMIKDGEEITLQYGKLGRKPVLPEQLEESLVEYALELKNNNFSLTGMDLREMAYHLAVKHGVRTPFAKSKMAGKHWLQGFLRRNPKLKFDETMLKIEQDLLDLTENLTCETLIDEIGVVSSIPDEDNNYTYDYGDDDDNDYDDEYDDY